MIPQRFVIGVLTVLKGRDDRWLIVSDMDRSYPRRP
jgi:hypothetical protein